MIDALRIVIHGRVQGVSYRAWAVEQASQLGLSGWVRNRADGTVEAAFCGETDRIANMVEACKTGPAAARVERIESFTFKEELSGPFTARPTV